MWNDDRAIPVPRRSGPGSVFPAARTRQRITAPASALHPIRPRVGVSRSSAFFALFGLALVLSPTAQNGPQSSAHAHTRQHIHKPGGHLKAHHAHSRDLQTPFPSLTALLFAKAPFPSSSSPPHTINLDTPRNLRRFASTVDYHHHHRHHHQHIACLLRHLCCHHRAHCTTMASTQFDSSSDGYVNILEQARQNFWNSHAYLSEEERQASWMRAASAPSSNATNASQQSMAQQTPRTMRDSMSNLTDLPV